MNTKPAESINNEEKINSSQESKIIPETIPSFNNDTLGYSSFYQKAISPKMFTHEQQADKEMKCQNQKLKDQYYLLLQI